jgi:hypothetical protein
MSELKVNKISPRSGTDVTLGDSGDAISVASGASLTSPGLTLSDNILFNTASKGIYLGVTSATAANLLDDYEEGTFTPTLDSIGSTDASGQYTKIGNVCTAKFKISPTESGSDINITGFPFTSQAGCEQQGLARETESAGNLWFIRLAATNTLGTIIRYDANNSIDAADTFQGQITYITNT